jgi:isopenicillin-N epimerase
MTAPNFAPPSLGKAVRGEWLLDPDWLTVNHGSFGATPRVVLAEQDRWRTEMERQPSRFMRQVLPNALRDAADRLAAFLGGAGCDLAFVENATVGCNAVLRSLPFKPGDEILMLGHVYGAVRNTIAFVAEGSGATVVEMPVPFPRPGGDELVASVAGALTERTRLAVLDHITSGSALVLPLERLTAACQAAGVPVLVDGAHAPGQATLDLPATGADWYVGNCHKWLMAPKGCAFLWTRPDQQDRIHPVTISHGYRQGYLAEFDWTGTRDPSAFLAVPVAIDFHARLGGAALRARNAALAAEGGSLLARRLNTDVGATAEMAGSMATVRLPPVGPATIEGAGAFRQRLLGARTDLPVFAQAGALWVRLSAQAYNELDDYEALAGILADLCRESA